VGLSRAALRQSFLSEPDRSKLEERFRRECDALGQELFGSSVEPPVN
jgi:hypothetical protein